MTNNRKKKPCRNQNIFIVEFERGFQFVTRRTEMTRRSMVCHKCANRLHLMVKSLLMIIQNHARDGFKLKADYNFLFNRMFEVSFVRFLSVIL